MALILFLSLLVPAAAWADKVDEVRIDSEHPRLLLNARRLKLLTRERERQSLRWQQFETLMVGGARMPEPGFSQALFYQVSKNESAGKKAVQWALGPAGTDLRQLSLVFDWCQPLLNDTQSAALAVKIRRGMEATANARDINKVRDGIFAGVALAGTVPKAPEAHIRRVLNEWWISQMTPALKSGGRDVKRQHIYALMEILHSVRDNLSLDLRESAPDYFKELPTYHLLSHYPAPYPAPENEFRLPVFDPRREPDLNQASLSRAAELSMVAFDSNARESQFLQGWLIRDRFLMRGAFGIAYELLWANPYQPGLSVFHMPLWFHDPNSGRLAIRSSWEEDADWFGHLDGFTQFFSHGTPNSVDVAKTDKSVQIGETVLAFPRQGSRLPIPEESKLLFVIGLQPNKAYNVEADDEEMRELWSDAGGILEVPLAGTGRTTVRFSPALAGN